MNVVKVLYDADLKSVLARLSCYFSKGPLKRDFLDIYLTTFSESVTSEIQKLSGPSFLQIFSSLICISKMRHKIEKTFFVSEIIASELVLVNCL